MIECVFCERIAGGNELVMTNETAVAFRDAFPISDGHTLVVPRQHVERPEQLSPDDWARLFALVGELCGRLGRDTAIDGINVGINSGKAAGQTVEHAHVHVIPRRLGDVQDPRGGVRKVIPQRANYWSGR